MVIAVANASQALCQLLVRAPRSGGAVGRGRGLGCRATVIPSMAVGQGDLGGQAKWHWRGLMREFSRSDCP